MSEQQYMVTINVDLTFYVLANDEDDAREQGLRELKKLDVDYDVQDIVVDLESL